MIYQKLLMGSKPYFISVSKSVPFEMHRHPEIELTFCIDGSCDIICENHSYTLKAGDLAVIPPMAKHEIPVADSSCKKLTIEVGYSLLGDFFNFFKSLEKSCIIYSPSLKADSVYTELSQLLFETAELKNLNSEFSELAIKGNLYKISALLLELCLSGKKITLQDKKSDDIKKIDKALERIYNSYYEQLSIDEISKFCGYSKSNFCKIFKSITGDTFHNTLNRHRIDMSCILLRETNYPIEKIAEETGFSDLKNFCRTFKNIMGVSAGKYRKNL